MRADEDRRPHGRLAVVVLGAVLISPPLLTSLAAQARPAEPPAPATAVLAGQAVDAVTGAPVAHTLIGLSQRARSGPNTTPTAQGTQLVTAMADSQGRFVFRDVPKGAFLVLATAPGYIVSNYGQARATGPTRTLDLQGNETLVDLKIPLWRHAVISGAVRDEAGEPVVGVVVRVLRRAPNGPGGYVKYQPGTQTTTDDRGEYRLTMLTPGAFIVTVPQTQVTVPAAVVDRYLQSVASRGGGTAAGEMVDLMSSSSAVPSAGGGIRIGDALLQSSANGRMVTVPPPGAAGVFVYPMVIHAPGSGREGEIVVGPGEERGGVDLQLRPERTVEVSGTVLADGAPAPNVAVRLIRQDGPFIQNDNGFEAAATVSGADGRFALLGVPPGTYVLKALRTPRATLPPGLASNPAIVAAYGPAGPAPGAGAPPLIGAQLDVAVGDADVRDLVVSLRSGATVRGRVTFTGRQPTPQQLQSFAALLTAEDGGLPGAGLLLGRVSADAAFSVRAPAPGEYMVTVLGPPAAGWRASGVLVAGRPLTGPLGLGGDDVTDMVVTFTTEVGGIAGTARRSDGTAVSTAGLVVFPIDRTRWTPEPLNVWQPRVEQTGRGGAFQLTGLLPGEYFLAALDDADVPELIDAAFFERVAAWATRVTVAANDSRTIDLVVRRLR